MMKITLLAFVFFAFWAALYAALRSRAGEGAGRLSAYILWLKASLDNMFYNLSERFIYRALFACVISAGAVGFILPDTYTHLNKKFILSEALELNRQGDYSAVTEQAEKLRDLNAPLAHNELGYAYLCQGSTEIAEQEFKSAVSLLPYYSKAYSNLVVVYSKQGRFDKASFAETRASETAKYPISEDALYGATESGFKGMLIRLLCAVIMLAAGYRIPRLTVQILQSRRMKKYDSQIAGGLTMMSNSLRAGLSLQQCLAVVCTDAQPPLSQEFRLVQNEINLGSSLEEALRHLGERMPTKDTKIFVNSVLILRETGGNLTEIFDTIANTVHERKRVQQKIKTMTAEGETQAIILTILPFVLAIILNKLMPATFSLMYKTPIGWLLIIAMLLMDAVGLLWMYKMVRMKI